MFMVPDGSLTIELRGQTDIESHYPLRVARYELRGNAEGAGENRGGTGPIRELEFTSPGRASIEGDGNKYPPWGFDGGEDGTPGQVVLDPDTKDEQHLSSKLENQSMDAEQRLRLVGPCGGGWGDPKKVRADVLDDFVSVERAREANGVVLTDDLEVDEEATEELRSERR